MNKAIAGIALAALTAGSALAADMPVKAPPAAVVSTSPWTGFYVGAGVGFRSSQSDPTVTDLTSGRFTTLAGECARFAQFFGGCFTSEPANDTAFRFSPYFGFNWQFASHWVAGVEGDVGFANKTTTINGMFYPESVIGWSADAGDTFSVKTTWDASARGRIGYLVTPTVLTYVTGGAAWLRVESTSNCSTADSGFCNSALLLSPPVIAHSTTKPGWTIGAGFEAALWSNWIARAEYRYADFGTITNTDFRAGGPVVGNNSLTETYDVALKTHTVTFGLAYKLGDPIATQPAAAYASVASAPSWGGFYLGAGVGARSSVGDVAVTGATGVSVFRSIVNPLDLSRCASLPADNPCLTNEPINDTAFRISPYLGYNWQIAPQWVAGVEGDVGFASKTTTLNGMFYPITFFGATGVGEDTFSVKTTWDASARGRIGYLVTPMIMTYATGGAAWLHVEATSSCGTTSTNAPPNGGFCVPGSFSPAVMTDSTTRLGWTIGGGIDATLWSNWIARAEYRYADFGTITNTDFRAGGPGVGGIPLIVSYNLALKTHTATFGLAYKFN